MARARGGALVALVSGLSFVALTSCDSPPAEVDAGPPGDAGQDAGPIEEGVISLPGLDGEVEVLFDDRGMPHIYASTLHDLMVAQGYLMARDRFGQMELIRRAVLGRLAVVLGGVDASLVDDDRDTRFLGFGRQGRAIYESLPATDTARLQAESFVEGINHYIDEVIMDDAWSAPRGLEVLNILALSEDFGHWEPADVFALARFQSWNLSYDAGADINRSRAREGVRREFVAQAGDDDRRAARVGVYADFFSEVQARRVYTRDGFNDGTTRAFLPPVTRPLPRTEPRLEAAALTGASRFFDRLDANPLFHRDEHVGSNSWVVSGEHTASGNPILSNDPHLSLVSPGVWWYVHLDTARAGGERMIEVQGVAFAGLPGVVLGYNRDIAWSATTTGYDVTDVYSEAVTFRNDGTPAAPEWVPVSVAFNGGDVALETITEVIGVSGSADENFLIYDVPHHGPLIPDTIVAPDVADPPAGAMEVGSAFSVRYTGHEVSNELEFFAGLTEATSVAEAFDAQDNFRVGAQNFSFASRTGDIGWSTQSRIPQRAAAACDFAIGADGTVSGNSPLFVLPGDGTAEWGDDLGAEFIPHDINPARGYIATANQDNVGVTDDGNPCNDAHYIGGGFAVGFRQGRILERLETLTPIGAIDVNDMVQLQGETRSSLGETVRDPLLASLEHALGTTDDDPALDALMTAAGADGVAAITLARDRLAAWQLTTPHGVDSADSNEIAESIATSIFNAIITRITSLAFEDEADLIGRRPSSSGAARLLEWSMMDAAEQQALPLYTYREDYLTAVGYADTVLWDDISTDAIETRDERVANATLAAMEWLETELGADVEQWRWGRVHAVRFNQVVPPALGAAIVSIPPEGSVEFPIGFPRHGDYGAVDVGNYGMFGGTRFTHGSGASMRMIVEMTPEGPRPFNALPGGQSEDIDSPHHADEAELWRENQSPSLYFDRADVESHMRSMVQFVPR